MKGKLFSPHTPDASIITNSMFTTEKLSKNSVKNYKPRTGLPLI